MANEIIFRRLTGTSYFITIRDIEDNYSIWDPINLEFEPWGTNPSANDLNSYKIDASETYGNGIFTVDMPSLINTSKRLLIEIYLDSTSTYDGSFVLLWNGSAQVFETDADGRITISSSGLDNISTSEPSGRATNFREMIVQLYQRFFNKVILNNTSLKVYDESGSVVTTQAASDTGSTQTVEKA
jgi:hypothetical protein